MRLKTPLQTKALKDCEPSELIRLRRGDDIFWAIVCGAALGEGRNRAIIFLNPENAPFYEPIWDDAGGDLVLSYGDNYEFGTTPDAPFVSS